MTNILDDYSNNFNDTQICNMSVLEYFELCKTDRMAYATAPERMIKAIGEPVKIDTSTDSRLSRIFLNRTILQYPAFKDFYGMEDTVERIVGYYKHAAQGLEERKQILYLLGPVGGGKSSIAERLKELMEINPIYIIAYIDSNDSFEYSPVFESPLAIFSHRKFYEKMRDQYGIDKRYLTLIQSPWLIKRLKQAGGDLNKFRVIKIMPSKLEQIGICKTEPGDENNQDISTLVGKTDIRSLERFSQNDTDAYAYSGALCRANQGMMEFVEMFKAPIKVLHPLLTATQENNYMGTENISAIPFNGMILAHCFSDDTELLTKNGWKLHNEISIGDSIATMNRNTGKMEYQPALNKFEQEYDGDMYHFLSNSADHLVTPNHKMIYHTQYTNDWRDITAEEFGKTGKIIPVSAENTHPDYDISDDLLKLMVWVVADGSLTTGNKIRFHLLKDRKIERLTDLLKRMNCEYSQTIMLDNTTDIRFINTYGLTKFIPDYYSQLSSRQGKIILEEYAHTDGHRKNGQDIFYQLSSNVKETIDRLHHIAIVSGCKANQCSHTKERYSPQYYLSVRMNITETRSDNICQKIQYKGKVFCFETENHTLVSRRNGKVLITGNSNMAEWMTFKNNKNNEAFIDRVCIIKVPYCLRVYDETKIYEKMIDMSELSASPCAPGTFEMMAQWSVLSRLKDHENSNLWSKMKVYDGENIKESDVNSKSIQEYRDSAGIDEGMEGGSTRFAFKVLSSTYNHDPNEIAADPVHLMYNLENAIRREQLTKEEEDRRLGFIKKDLAPKYNEFISNEIQTAYLETYSEFGQTLFDRYINYADHWMQDVDYKDQDTGSMFNREYLNAELEKIEKPAGIANPKDFRHECVNFVLRQRAGGNFVKWNSYEKLKKVIERKMFTNVEELLPVISFSVKSTTEDSKKHDDFVKRMMERGYTEKQVRRSVEWFMRVRKA